MKRNWLSVMVIIAVTLSVIGGAPRIAYADDVDIIISEIMFNSFCGSNTGTTLCGTGTDETQFEWVEIYNRGATPVNLSNWRICDKVPGTSQVNCDVLAGTIGIHEYWLIAVDNNSPNHTDIIAELANYGDTLNIAQTIFLANSIGSNGLANGTATGGDAVLLVTAQSNCGAGSAACVTDCVSWDSVATCASLVDGTTRAYLNGANGFDNSTTLSNNEGQGQSIVNIQGAWSVSGPGIAGVTNQASPYAQNTAVGGSPNAVTLSDLSATTPVSPAPIVFGALGLIAAAMLLRRKAAHTTSN